MSTNKIINQNTSTLRKIQYQTRKKTSLQIYFSVKVKDKKHLNRITFIKCDFLTPRMIFLLLKYDYLMIFTFSLLHQTKRTKNDKNKVLN